MIAAIAGFAREAPHAAVAVRVEVEQPATPVARKVLVARAEGAVHDPPVAVREPALLLALFRMVGAQRSAAAASASAAVAAVARVVSLDDCAFGPACPVWPDIHLIPNLHCLCACCHCRLLFGIVLLLDLLFDA